MVIIKLCYIITPLAETLVLIVLVACPVNLRQIYPFRAGLLRRGILDLQILRLTAFPSDCAVVNCGPASDSRAM